MITNNINQCFYNNKTYYIHEIIGSKSLLDENKKVIIPHINGSIETINNNYIIIFKNSDFFEKIYFIFSIKENKFILENHKIISYKFSKFNNNIYITSYFHKTTNKSFVFINNTHSIKEIKWNPILDNELIEFGDSYVSTLNSNILTIYDIEFNIIKSFNNISEVINTYNKNFIIFYENIKSKISNNILKKSIFLFNISDNSLILLQETNKYFDSFFLNELNTEYFNFKNNEKNIIIVNDTIFIYDSNMNLINTIKSEYKNLTIKLHQDKDNIFKFINKDSYNLIHINFKNFYYSNLWNLEKKVFICFNKDTYNKKKLFEEFIGNNKLLKRKYKSYKEIDDKTLLKYKFDNELIEI